MTSNVVQQLPALTGLRTTDLAYAAVAFVELSQLTQLLSFVLIAYIATWP